MSCWSRTHPLSRKTPQWVFLPTASAELVARDSEPWSSFCHLSLPSNRCPLRCEDSRRAPDSAHRRSFRVDDGETCGPSETRARCIAERDGAIPDRCPRSFARLREIARCMGVTLDETSADWRALAFEALRVMLDVSREREKRELGTYEEAIRCQRSSGLCKSD